MCDGVSLERGEEIGFAQSGDFRNGVTPRIKMYGTGFNSENECIRICMPFDPFKRFSRIGIRMSREKDFVRRK